MIHKHCYVLIQSVATLLGTHARLMSAADFWSNKTFSAEKVKYTCLIRSKCAADGLQAAVPTCTVGKTK